MCKQKPAVNNGGQDVSSSNMAIGLVNFSNEEFSLSKPHHRTEIIAILIFIMILAFGLYKLRRWCLKKRNNQLANTTPHAPLPYSPPNYARDVPYDPAYYPAQQGGSYLSKVIKIISHLTFSMQNLILRNFCFLEKIPKMPPQLVKMHFLFTKEFAQKYIGKINISVFCIFCFIFFSILRVFYPIDQFV